MSLEIHSSDSALETLINTIVADQSVSPLEFQKIRDVSDEAVEKLKGASPALVEQLNILQSTADALAETLQKLTITIRRDKPDAEKLERFKAAIEHQIVYIVLSYKSSLERYTPKAQSAQNPTTLTPQQLEHVRADFESKDKDGNGFLTTEEFLSTLQNVLTPATINKIMQSIDTNNDGKVSWEEFLRDREG